MYDGIGVLERREYLGTKRMWILFGGLLTVSMLVSFLFYGLSFLWPRQNWSSSMVGLIGWSLRNSGWCQKVEERPTR